MLRIGMAQFSPVLGDVNRNLEIILDFIKQAKSQGCGLVIFPENALTGYFLRDLVTEVCQAPDSEIIRTIEKESNDIDILLGFVEQSPEFNNYIAAGYFTRGKLAHIHRKVYLPNYGMFEDMRYFAQGESISAFDAPFGRMGILICEDALHPLLSYILTMDGAIVLHVISNSPLRGMLKSESDTLEKWEETLRFLARIYGVYITYTNRSGFEDGIHYGGNSVVFDPTGALVVRGKKGESDFVTAEINLEEVNRARTRMPLIRDENIPLAIKELSRIYTDKR
jgi:predicted amidohydrolase